MNSTPSSRRYGVKSGLLALLLLAAGFARAGTDFPPHATFDAALLAYESNHWHESFLALAALADCGHPEAARMALLMWRHGPALFDTTFSARAEQVQQWIRVASSGGATGATLCTSAPQSP